MHAGGAAQLGHPADGLLHLLGGHQHQIGQLVDDHHNLGHLLHALGLGGVGVVTGQIPHPDLREGPVALHHLHHRPLEGARRLLGVGDHGNEQMGDAVVDAQLHHLGVHHDEAHLLRGGLVEQGDNQRVGTHRLARAGSAGDEQVGQLGNIAHHIAVADVPAHSKGNLGGVVPELTGVDDIVDIDRGDELVGHLDAHHGDLVRDGGDANAGSPQGQGDIVSQVGQLVKPHPLVQLHLVPGHRWAAGHIGDGSIDAEGPDGVGQAGLIGLELAGHVGARHACPLVQQRNRRILVGRRSPLLQFAGDVLGHLGRRLGSLLPLHLGHSGLPLNLRHRRGRGGLRDGFQHRFRRLSCLLRRLRRRGHGDGFCLRHIPSRRTGQYLVRRGHRGLPVEKALLLLNGLGLGPFAHQRTIVHGDIDLRHLLAAKIAEG